MIKENQVEILALKIIITEIKKLTGWPMYYWIILQSIK